MTPPNKIPVPTVPFINRFLRLLGAWAAILYPVITAIQGRDYARIYMKELERGKASVALSPEEQEAVNRAMGR